MVTVKLLSHIGLAGPAWLPPLDSYGHDEAKASSRRDKATLVAETATKNSGSEVHVHSQDAPLNPECQGNGPECNSPKASTSPKLKQFPKMEMNDPNYRIQF